MTLEPGGGRRASLHSVGTCLPLRESAKSLTNGAVFGGGAGTPGVCMPCEQWLGEKGTLTLEEGSSECILENIFNRLRGLLWKTGRKHRTECHKRSP